MKASYFLSGLALGVLAGGAIGYLIASDPRKRAKIQRFIDDVGETLEEKVEDVKAKLLGTHEGDFSDEMNVDLA